MSVPFDPATALTGIRFGAAYYPEYEATDTVEQDLDLMTAAGVTVIRVGESTWSTWEPSDGVFSLDWLQPTLDGAHARGIGVILGTPTYAVPPWLQVKHPEIAADLETGKPMPWGARQEIDYSNPTFRRYAERIIRAVVGRYADHPAVIGYQVDNEPGNYLFHNEGSFTRFVDDLRAKYGDVETLNREWGLTYWSHRLTSFDELWRPDGNSFPQYDLAWRRHQALLTTEFIAWQADIVREYSSPEQFVTTCLAYPRPAQDDSEVTRALDVTAGNPYYSMQDQLSLDAEVGPAQPWQTSSVAGLLRQADRIYSSKQSRYLVTETNSGSIGGPYDNFPAYPGQLRQAALTLIARGAAMIEYWHWHTLHAGTETYWVGVIPHNKKPGRIYRETAELGAWLGGLGTTLDGYVPDADVTILYSNESKWALEYYPHLANSDATPDRNGYQHVFDAFHAGVVGSGAQARIMHASQLEGSPAELAAAHPVLVVPAFYVATDAELARFRDYAAAGGHLVIGVWTGYADHEARARAEVAPARLADAAGAWYEEFSNIRGELPLIGSGSLALSPGARATGWIEGLIPDGAEVLAGYDHPEHGRFAAITTSAFEQGRVTIVGTVPNDALARDLARWLVPAPITGEWTRGSTVTVASGSLPDGRRAVTVFNWSSTPSSVTIPVDATDPVSGESFAAGHELPLERWAAVLLVVGDATRQS